MSGWIPAILLLCIAVACRYVSRSWLAPSAFTAGLWTIYIGLALAVAPDYNVQGMGTWYIAVLVGMMAVGSLMLERRPATPRSFEPQRIFHISIAFSAIALIGAAYDTAQEIAARGVSLFVLGRLVYTDHLAGRVPPIITRATIIWAFPAAVLAGIAFSSVETRKHKLLCFAPFASTVLVSIENATKANTLMAVVLWLSGWLAMMACTRRKINIFTRKTMLRLAAGAAVAVCGFIGAESLRQHTEDNDFEIVANWSKIKAQAFGYLACFDFWTTYPDNQQLGASLPGSYTFAGLFDMAGLSAQVANAEVVRYDERDLDGNGHTSNIQTVFRGLIQDFTLPGAAFSLLLFGLLGGWAYSRGNLAMLAGVYAFIVFSPLVSVFMYNGAVLAVVVASLACRQHRMSSPKSPYVSP